MIQIGEKRTECAGLLAIPSWFFYNSIIVSNEFLAKGGHFMEKHPIPFGFEEIRSIPLEELGGVLHQYEHEKTGAQLL